nr:MAG TPA: hypothetical protein [Caudoviricetes sp.]
MQEGKGEQERTRIKSHLILRFLIATRNTFYGVLC